MRMKNLASAALVAAGLALVGGCSGMGGGAMGGMGGALGPIGAIAQVGSMMGGQKSPEQQQQQQQEAQQAGYRQQAQTTSMNLTGTLRSTRNAGGVVDGWLLTMGEGGMAYELDVSDVQDVANQLDGKKVAVTGSMRTDAAADGQDASKMPAVKATKITAL